MIAINNFAIIFSNDGTNAAVRVYNSALSNIYSYGVAGTPTGMAIAGNSWGGFAISFFGSSGNFRSFVPTGTSTWSPGSAFTYSLDAYVQNPQMVATQSGMYVITGTRSSVPAYAMGGLAGPKYNIPTNSVSIGKNQIPGYNKGGAVHHYDVGGFVVNAQPGQDEKMIASMVVDMLDQKNVMRAAMSGVGRRN